MGTATLAHEGAMGIVKERMDGMKAIGAAVKSIAPMMTGKADFDVSLAEEAAAKIIEHSGQNMIDRFPEGSLDQPSEASPLIWEDPEGFATIALELETLAGTISDETLDADARASLFQKIGATCKSCHQGYRVRR
ncbi:MAG: cytochrome c [Pseudomonadota bacterium]